MVNVSDKVLILDFEHGTIPVQCEVVAPNGPRKVGIHGAEWMNGYFFQSGTTDKFSIFLPEKAQQLKVTAFSRQRPLREKWADYFYSHSYPRPIEWLANFFLNHLGNPAYQAYSVTFTNFSTNP
jgi:hypothetical protein